jgi:hypothetical protein
LQRLPAAVDLARQLDHVLAQEARGRRLGDLEHRDPEVPVASR